MPKPGRGLLGVALLFDGSGLIIRAMTFADGDIRWERLGEVVE